MNEFRIDKAAFAGQAKRTQEGYIDDHPVVTRTGVFPYRNLDGSIRYELRHPHDVFSRESLDSLSRLPITLEHPTVMVDASNAKALAIGFTGDAATVDGQNVITSVRITDAEAVAAIEAGKRELSLGYRTDLVEVAGHYEGTPYTHRQTNIRYNHLAVVERARVGAAARLRIDGAEQVDDLNPIRKDADMPDNLVDIRLDSLIYKGAPEVSLALDRLRADAQTATATIAELTKKVDTATARADAAEEKVKALEAKDSGADIQAAVKSRLALVKCAEAAKLDKATLDRLDGLTDREIREAVIKADSPTADLTGKSEDYIIARFDAAVESLGRHTDASGKQRAAVLPRQDGQQVNRVDDARARMESGIDWRTRDQKAAV